MRSKTEYVLVDKNGKQVPEKVGLAPVQRDGAEYEYTVVININMQHTAEATKDRTGLFDGKFFTPSLETGKQLLDWLESGVDAPEPPPELITPAQLQKLQIVAKEQGLAANDMKAILAWKYNVDSSKKLTKIQASYMIEHLDKIWTEVVVSQSEGVKTHE